jgi:hypothetical protein
LENFPSKALVKPLSDIICTVPEVDTLPDMENFIIRTKVPDLYRDEGRSVPKILTKPLLLLRLWELVERKEPAKTQVVLDQLDLDLRTGEAMQLSGEVLNITTAAGDKVRALVLFDLGRRGHAVESSGPQHTPQQ